MRHKYKKKYKHNKIFIFLFPVSVIIWYERIREKRRKIREKKKKIILSGEK